MNLSFNIEGTQLVDHPYEQVYPHHIPIVTLPQHGMSSPRGEI
jgi:hypothetical protein